MSFSDPKWAAHNALGQGNFLADFYIDRWDWDVNNNVIYQAWAKPGTADSAAGWLIKKRVYDVNNNPTSSGFKSGSLKFDGVWDDRASYTYS